MKFILLAASIFLYSCMEKRPEITGLEGTPLPNFSLQLPDSISWLKSIDIKKGIPSAYFLFSVYCPHCKSQLSKITENIDALKGIDIYMITQESYIEMRDYYKFNELNKYSNIKVGRDSSGILGEYLKVKGIPFLAIYDKNKILKRAYSGPTNTKIIASTIPE